MRKLIPLDQIDLTGVQVRVATDSGHIEDLADAYRRKATVPPPDLFDDGKSKLRIGDGLHRITAAGQAGLKKLECEVHKGSAEECLRFALGSNSGHGLKRTPADKRRCLELAIAQWPKMSGQQLAEVCAVSVRYACEVRSQVLPGNTSVVGRDGKEYPASRPHSSPPPFTQPTRDDEEKPHVTSGPPPLPKQDGCSFGQITGLQNPLDKPPKPAQELDTMGYPIPAKVLPRWQEAIGVQTLLNALSGVRSNTKKAEDEKDPLWHEVNMSSLKAAIDQAYEDLKCVKPHVVCTTCQGRASDQCRFCGGRGFISKFRWDTMVPIEVKKLREKAIEAL